MDGQNENQILVAAEGKEIGQVNSRAAAILAPLLQGQLIDVEIQQNQDPEGSSGRALYIYAKVGVDDNSQVSFLSLPCLPLSVARILPGAKLPNMG